MVLTIHHLGISQSERIVWLLEELGVEYKLVKHDRDPLAAPQSLKSLPGNTLGKAPFFEDPEAGVTLAESGAIAEYLIRFYSDGTLGVKPTDGPKFAADYLYWLHWCNATFHNAIQTKSFLQSAEVPADKMIMQFNEGRVVNNLKQMDDRLAQNQWLAGERFTAADVMVNYDVTTNRYFSVTDLTGYTNILRWIKDCSNRPAYQRARKKGDPEMKDLLEAKGPAVGLMASGGIASDIWRKK